MTTLLKKCLCRSQLCATCYVLVFIFLMVYIYSNCQSNSQLLYERDQELKNFLTQEDFRGDSLKSISKPEKVYNKTEQKELPNRPGDVNKNKISSQKEKNEQKENKSSNQDTNQQKVLKLPDKPGNVIESKPPNQKEATGRLDEVNQNQADPRMNATHINGILMEPINTNYTRNIYFTVKTTHKFYTERLFPLMLTWLQLMDKNKLSIITDKSPNKSQYVDMFRRAGFQIVINDECWDDTHSRWGLCCKMGTEFATYYKAVEEHPGEEDRYQWFCHADDDAYVNVLMLSHLLQQYDPHKPYYIGNFPHAFYKLPYLIYHLSHNPPYHFKHLPSKRRFQYATGSTFCISYALMMEGKEFMNGPEPFNNISLSMIPSRADDMTVGFIIDALLGHNLTDVANITSQLNGYVRRSSLDQLTKYFTISITTAIKSVSLGKFASSLKTPLPSADPTRLLLYHCLLYPTVSWCSNVRETLNANPIV